MQSIIDAIEQWLKDFLIGAITGNLSNMFSDVNNKVATIATEVGKTPESWNSDVFSIILTLSRNVVVPIAGLVIAAVLTYELISMIVDKNNMHDRVFCEGGFSNTSNINDGQLICGRMKPTHTEGGTPLLYMNKRL